MFVFVSHLSVPEAEHAELERHFRERSRRVDSFPGFLYLQLLRPQAGPATHTRCSTFPAQAAPHGTRPFCCRRPIYATRRCCCCPSCRRR